MPAIDALIGLIASLLVVYGLDFWTQRLREAGFRSLDVTPYYWGSILANLVFAAILLALAWLTYFRAERRRLVVWLYLLTGLIVAFSSILLSSIPASLPLFTDPQFRILRIGLLYSGAHSRLQFLGAFLAILGALGISPDFNRWVLERLRAMWQG